MIAEMVQSTVHKMMREAFSHCLIPAAMHAQVTGRREVGTYVYESMTITACDTCGTLADKQISGKWYEYSLKILTRDGRVDARYPEIPQVKSKFQIAVGGKAAVVMLYGELRPYIAGEAM